MNTPTTAGINVERLPFRVRRAAGPQDLAKVVEIRAKSYARHLPIMARSLVEPEPDDRRADAILLLAERKLDGAPLGTTRLVPNFTSPLSSETAAALPAQYRDLRILEASRLGVDDGDDGLLVTAALVKATYLVGIALEVDCAIAIARRSAAKFFQRMGYDAIAGPRRFAGVPVPLWVLAMPTAEFEPRLRHLGHPYQQFICETMHPDIDVTAVASRLAPALALA